MAKGGLHPGAPGDQLVVRLQLEPGESAADKERLEREQFEHYKTHINLFRHVDPLATPKIEWVDAV